MPNPNISQLLTTTLANYKNEITDNILNSNPLLMKLKQKGNVIRESGGVSFQEKISYAQNGTIQSQGEYDLYDTTPQDVLTTAEFAQKIVTGTFTMTDAEMKQNAGKEGYIKLSSAKKRVLESSMQNYFGASSFGDGTGNGGKDIGGLQLLVADDPTSGTVGGINRAAYTFWRNKVVSFADDTPGGSGTAATSNIQDAFNLLWIRCQAQANNLPDLILADANYFGYFEKSLQQIERITTAEKGQLGFSGIKYKTADVFYDQNCPSNHAYFLNTNHIFLKHLGDLFDVGETTRPYNQGAYCTPITFMGNMTIDNARVHGVLTA